MSRNLIFVLVESGVYFLHQLFEANSPDLINSYLDDLLFLPVMFGLAHEAHRWLNPGKSIPWLFWLALGLLCSFIAENYYSKWNDAFTYDTTDYLFYLLGFVLFLWQSDQLFPRYSRHRN